MCSMACLELVIVLVAYNRILLTKWLKPSECMLQSSGKQVYDESVSRLDPSSPGSEGSCLPGCLVS